MAKFTRPNNRPELLLHPNIPKPLHGLNPRTLLGDAWWRDTREEALVKWFNSCAVCGIEKKMAPWSPTIKYPHLECHEIYDINYKLGTMTFIEVVPLCYYCHAFIHNGHLMIEHAKGNISDKEFDAISKHGKKVLNGLTIKKPPKACAEWNAWRLIIGTTVYERKFNTYLDWADHYGVKRRFKIDWMIDNFYNENFYYD